MSGHFFQAVFADYFLKPPEKTMPASALSAASEACLRQALALPREREKLMRLEAELVRTVDNPQCVENGARGLPSPVTAHH